MATWKRWAVAATVAALTGAAQAALIDLGDGTVKDTSTNLIWLKDWNVNGTTNWASQMAWAQTTLDGFAGSNDWQLPTLQQYLDLFAAYGDLTDPQLPFVDVQPAFYWSRTEQTTGSIAFSFSPLFGFSGPDSEDFDSYAVAVRQAPAPQTLVLAVLALGATALARRRRRA